MQAMKIKSALATEHTNGTRVVTANRESLVTESFGDPGGPAHSGSQRVNDALAGGVLPSDRP